MRKYKTFCVNCGIETRNTKKDFTKPIDYCRKCIDSAKAERKIKEFRAKVRKHNQLINFKIDPELR